MEKDHKAGQGEPAGGTGRGSGNTTMVERSPGPLQGATGQRCSSPLRRWPGGGGFRQGIPVSPGCAKEASQRARSLSHGDRVISATVAGTGPSSREHWGAGDLRCWVLRAFGCHHRILSQCTPNIGRPQAPFLLRPFSSALGGRLLPGSWCGLPSAWARVYVRVSSPDRTPVRLDQGSP